MLNIETAIKNTEKQLKKLKQIDKEIKEANKNFKKMTADQKRVAIAKDVIEQLNSKKYTAKANSYLIVSVPNNNIIGLLENEDKHITVGDIDMSALLCDPETKCECCARAAIFASSVRKFNNFQFGEFNRFYEGHSDLDPKYSNKLNIENKDMENRETRFFSPLQITMIEACFEQNVIEHNAPGGYIWNNKDHAVSANASALYGESIKGSTKDRMIVIMKNIIKNKGEFVVPDEFLEKARNDNDNE